MSANTPFNWQGIVQTLQKQILLQYGMQMNPIIIVDSTAVSAPTGACFYQFRAVGGNVVIDTILDIDGNAITGMSGVTLTPTDFPYNLRASSIKLTSGKLLCYRKIIQDL